MSAAPPLLHVTVYTHRLMNTHLGCSSRCVSVYSLVMRRAVCDLEAGLCVHVPVLVEVASLFNAD